MHPVPLPAYRNSILAALLPNELCLVRPHLIREFLVVGQVLHEPGQQMDQVYFFEQGFASTVAVAGGDNKGVEVGIVGRDSMLGLPIMINPAPIAFNRSIVQIPGVAYRMAASRLFEGLASMPALTALLRRHFEVHIAQTSQAAACNSHHTVLKRCARWLLTAHDQVDGDELRLTQAFLSIMLAVRRAGVTAAMQALQKAGCVQPGRGRIMVCDRAGLERAECGCYGRVRAFEAAAARSNAVEVEDLSPRRGMSKHPFTGLSDGPPC